MEETWLSWVKSLQAIAQNGLTFSENQFDIARYKEIRKIAADILARYSSSSSDEILKFFETENGYATPKVDIRGAVFKDDKILLVKEISDGGWTLPGGWADPNETPSLAVEREVFEESGFEVKARKLIAVYDRTKQKHTPPYPYHVYKLFFLCDLIGGEKKHSIETDGVDFFKEDEIPRLSDARVKLHQIKRFFEFYRNPSLQADFD